MFQNANWAPPSSLFITQVEAVLLRTRRYPQVSSLNALRLKGITLSDFCLLLVNKALEISLLIAMLFLKAHFHVVPCFM